jgi:hypothetical protein
MNFLDEIQDTLGDNIGKLSVWANILLIIISKALEIFPDLVAKIVTEVKGYYVFIKEQIANGKTPEEIEMIKRSAEENIIVMAVTDPKYSGSESILRRTFLKPLINAIVYFVNLLAHFEETGEVIDEKWDRAVQKNIAKEQTAEEYQQTYMFLFGNRE